MRLSKSKIMAFRQCPRRLWLEIHKPELRDDSAATKASFAAGHTVGDIARNLYDPTASGSMVDIHEGFDAAFSRTSELLAKRRPIFEAGFSTRDTLAFADVLLPVPGSQHDWRMVEVKSSASVKEYQRDDAAVQAFIAKSAGVSLSAVAVAHVNSNWVYPGDGIYQGLLAEKDLTEDAVSRAASVQSWIAQALSTGSRSDAPAANTGSHCTDPFECGFINHCRSMEPHVAHPIRWLPKVQAKALKVFLAQDGIASMEQVPDELLNPLQQRVKHQTLEGSEYFDSDGAVRALKNQGLPAYFLDFETIQFAVPIWAGTRPYQQIPFQFSVHRLLRTGTLQHKEFLDLSGANPSRPLSEALIEACGESGPIYVYSSFEATRIRALAEDHPSLRSKLLAFLPRLVDLRPVAEQHYYHPSQAGSWSIKQVLAAAFPDLAYSHLEGVADGAAASAAYAEAACAPCAPERKLAIDKQLRTYCGRDTYGLVRLREKFVAEASE